MGDSWGFDISTALVDSISESYGCNREVTHWRTAGFYPASASLTLPYSPDHRVAPRSPMSVPPSYRTTPLQAVVSRG